MMMAIPFISSTLRKWMQIFKDMGKKFAIVAECDRLNSKCYYNGQKVLKYDGTTIRWVQKEFDSCEEAKTALYEQALGEYGAIEKDYDFVLSEVRNTDDLNDIKDIIDEWEHWGEGVYVGSVFLISKGDDSYKLDDITYTIEEIPTKKAFLVTASVCTRVVVDEDASDEEIMDAARARLLSNLNNDYYDNIDDIVADVECPFGSLREDSEK